MYFSFDFGWYSIRFDMILLVVFAEQKKSVKHDKSYLSTVPKLYHTQALDIARLDPNQIL